MGNLFGDIRRKKNNAGNKTSASLSSMPLSSSSASPVAAAFGNHSKTIDSIKLLSYAITPTTTSIVGDGDKPAVMNQAEVQVGTVKEQLSLSTAKASPQRIKRTKKIGNRKI